MGDSQVFIGGRFPLHPTVRQEGADGAEVGPTHTPIGDGQSREGDRPSCTTGNEQTEHFYLMPGRKIPQSLF